MQFRLFRFSLPVILSVILIAFVISSLPHSFTHAEPTYDCATAIDIPEIECEALVALYNATDGPNWNYNDGWLESNRPCSWAGVYCETDSVSWLGLADNNLEGALPPEIGNLTNLADLDLSGNQITSLPSEFGNLTLLDLDLSNNQLSSLPPELGNLINLDELPLNNNQLTSLPPELGNLTNLVRLHLHDNRLLDGAMPVELTNLTHLGVFNYYNTDLCAPDTPAFTNWLDSIHTVFGTGFVCGQAPGAISGTVSEPDGPLLTGQVALYRAVGSDSSWILVEETAVNAAGQFVLGNLGQDIAYYAYFKDADDLYNPEYYDDVRTIALGTPITVTLGITRTGIDATLWLNSMNRYLPVIMH